MLLLPDRRWPVAIRLAGRSSCRICTRPAHSNIVSRVLPFTTTVQPLTMTPDQYSSLSCLRPTSCHLRVINTSFSIMHAGGRISNIWLDNKFIPSGRERSFLWPSGYLLFFRNELRGIFCGEGKMLRTKGIS